VAVASTDLVEWESGAQVTETRCEQQQTRFDRLSKRSPSDEEEQSLPVGWPVAAGTAGPIAAVDTVTDCCPRSVDGVPIGVGTTATAADEMPSARGLSLGCLHG